MKILIKLSILVVVALGIIGIILFTFFSIRISRDYQSNVMISPTGTYEMYSTINRKNKEADTYALVVINLLNRETQDKTVFNSGVSDAQRWSLGWDIQKDIIVLQSSDIGNQGWEIREGKLIPLSLDTTLRKRAEQLYSEKYQ